MASNAGVESMKCCKISLNPCIYTTSTPFSEIGKGANYSKYSTNVLIINYAKISMSHKDIATLKAY